MRELGRKIGLLWRTVRWLKVRQITGRVRFRLQRPRLDLRPAPGLRRPSGPWHHPAEREASLTGPTSMRFLGVEQDLAAVGWDAPDVPLLWRYNQHYFDDLNASGASARSAWHQALVQRWLADNPPGRGTAWAPYPLSLRVVNWIKWFLGGQTPQATWLDSLAAQARWLTQRLEWHLLGNHLFINAKALVFAGLYFQGEEADTWLATGLTILQQELPEQFLSDGGQFERSPMYHALGLEDLLDLVQVVEHLAPAASPARAMLPDLRARASRALHWLRCMVHPAGALVRFNDSADGIAPSTAELERYAQALGIAADPVPAQGAAHLADTGYARLSHGPAVAFLDLARVGPDYLPGHAHADTLCFELSVHDRALLVNRGTSVYGTGERRLLERGTAAHNTVQLGERNSSEVWSGFRVGRRARPRDVSVSDTEARGTHDGYSHLPQRPMHRRHWQMDAASLRVDDELLGSGSQPLAEPATARFHLHPGLALVPAGPGRWHVVADNGTLATAEVLLGTAHVEPWDQALRFGQLQAAQTLAVTLDQGRSAVRWHWPESMDA